MIVKGNYHIKLRIGPQHQEMENEIVTSDAESTTEQKHWHHLTQGSHNQI